MIVLNKIKSKNEGDDLILSSLLEIDENNFELAVRIKGLEWHKDVYKRQPIQRVSILIW